MLSDTVPKDGIETRNNLSSDSLLYLLVLNMLYPGQDCPMGDFLHRTLLFEIAIKRKGAALTPSTLLTLELPPLVFVLYTYCGDTADQWGPVGASASGTGSNFGMAYHSTALCACRLLFEI